MNDSSSSIAVSALAFAIDQHRDDRTKSPAQIVTTARRFHKFLTAPEGAKDDATEE